MNSNSNWREKYLCAVEELLEARRQLAEMQSAINALRKPAAHWQQLVEALARAYDNDACIQAWMPNPRLDTMGAVMASLDRLDMRPLGMYANPTALRRAALAGRLKAEKIGGVWMATESAVRDYYTRTRTRNGRGNGRG